MEWNDTAIILSATKYSENSAIVSLLSQNNGKFKGLVRNITSAKNRGTYQTGNLITVSWKARLDEHLGFFTGEVNKAFAPICMSNHLELLAISSICAILDKTLAEREPCNNIYDLSLNMQEKIISNSNWLIDYIIFELTLLKELGFCLELNYCAATGQTHNLKYVSPKSGRAVSYEAGFAYHNKLLPLPDFLTTAKSINIVSLQDIKNGLALSAYFLNKYVFKANNIALPNVRVRLQAMI